MGEPEGQLLQFKILPAKADDFLALAEVEAVSNIGATKTPLESNVTYLMFGLPNDECIQSRVAGLKEMLRDDPAMKSYKGVMVDGQGQEKIVAWAQWGFYTEEQPIKDYVDKEWPASANGKACNDIIRVFSIARQKYMSGKKHACKWLCSTHPLLVLQGIWLTRIQSYKCLPHSLSTVVGVLDRLC